MIDNNNNKKICIIIVVLREKSPFTIIIDIIIIKIPIYTKYITIYQMKENEKEKQIKFIIL